MSTVEVQRPRHGEFRVGHRHRRVGEARRHHRHRHAAGHARNRQGHHGRAVHRQRRGGESARRQGWFGVHGCADRHRKAEAGAAAPAPAATAARPAATPAARRAQAAPPAAAAKPSSIDVSVPDMGSFDSVSRHRRAGEAGRHGRHRLAAGHARNRQGHDGCAVDRQGRRREGARHEGRQGFSRRAGGDRQGRGCGGRAAPAPRKRAPAATPDKPAAQAARPAAPQGVQQASIKDGAGCAWRSAAHRRSQFRRGACSAPRCASSRASWV